jgi:integrase
MFSTHMLMQPAQQPRLLKPSIDEFIARKRTQNRRANYIDCLEYELGRFAKGREDMKLSDITVDVIESAIKPTWKPGMTRSVLAKFSVFLGDCERRDYITRNPVTRIDKPTADVISPVVFKPTELSELLRLVSRKRPDLLAYAVLGTFLGVRPHEICKLKWTDIDTSLRPLRGVDDPHGLLTIDTAVSKVRRRRIVPIPSTVVEWLKRADTDGPIGSTGNPTRPLAKLAKKLTIAWHHDIMRHSAASYLLAKYEDAPRVALWLGNSPSVLMTRYYTLIHPDACTAFWSIRPTV